MSLYNIAFDTNNKTECLNHFSIEKKKGFHSDLLKAYFKSENNEVLAVAICYDSKTKKHSCKIERIQ